MPVVNVITREGVEHRLDGQVGNSVMEVIRKAGISELAALCGGCLSCATCHVYVDPAFAAVVPQISDDEEDLLDSSYNCRTESRLSCQLKLTPEMDGIVVRIAPEG